MVFCAVYFSDFPPKWPISAYFGKVIHRPGYFLTNLGFGAGYRNHPQEGLHKKILFLNGLCDFITSLERVWRAEEDIQ